MSSSESSLRIGLIEDTRDNLEFMIPCLAGNRIKFVARTKSGATYCINRLHPGEIDAIFLDHELMYGENSTDLIPIIRDKDKKIMIIGTSSNGRVPNIDDYLEKWEVGRIRELILPR